MRIFLTGMLAPRVDLKSVASVRDHEPQPVGRGALRSCSEDLLECGGRQRPVHVMTLALVAAEGAQPLVLARGLDAFGDEPQAQASRERDACSEDGGVVGVLAQPADEQTVELQ